MTAPVASGWSDGRVGLAPTGKAPPYHGAHPKQPFKFSDPNVCYWIAKQSLAHAEGYSCL
jgi:hypothetical protein